MRGYSAGKAARREAIDTVELSGTKCKYVGCLSSNKPRASDNPGSAGHLAPNSKAGAERRGWRVQADGASASLAANSTGHPLVWLEPQLTKLLVPA